MDMLVVEILKIFRELPDMYIIKAFIKTCWPGLVARAMACAWRLARMAAWFGPVVVVGDNRLRSAVTTWEYPTDGGSLVRV